MAYSASPRHFTRGVLWRVAGLLASLLGLSWAIAAGITPLVAVSFAALALLATWELIRFVHRTNRTLARFLDALRYEDFSQSFRGEEGGAGFEVLSHSLETVMQRLRKRRAKQEEEARYLRAVVEHAPLPILSLGPDGRLALLNNAARRIFGAAGHVPARRSDLEAHGPDFVAALGEMRAGEQRVLALRTEEGERRVAVSVAEVSTAAGRQRLVTVQNISGALDRTEYEAWQQLVRVLTHEIMNSLTPVSSLAESAHGLIIAAQEDPEALADAQAAVETVARRASALMGFVESYRALTRLPPPERRRLELSDVFARLCRLAESEWGADGPTLDSVLPPGGLTIEADADQLEQALINLLRNAREAVEGVPAGRIRLSARRSRHGRAIIEVQDSGPGVSEETASDIFLPFFTTKRGGSGIGLALTRQIMLAHGGTVSVDRSDALGGARFSLTF